MINKKFATGVAVLAVGSATAVHAQTSYVRPSYQFPAAPLSTGAASVQVGDSPFFASPYVGVGIGHDDNLFLSNTNERGSTLYIVSPGLKVDARSANKVLQVGYQGQAGFYAQSEDDNYVDHTAKGQFDMAIDHRNFLQLGLNYLRAHDPRGSTDRPIESRPDRYELTNPYATYAFGSPGAQGRIELYASDADKRYRNNREVTRASDRRTSEFGGAFYWRAMPKTYLLAEARRTNIDYRLSGSPFSGDETRYYGGVTWEATAATTGTVKFGRLKREFDQGAPEFRGSSWEAAISWLPKTYSRFDFYSARQSNESTGLGTFILTSVTGVTWTHDWSSYLRTGVDLRYQKDEYQNFDRNDETKSLGLKVGYRFRRWLNLGAEYTYSQRDSTLRRFEYDKNLYLLTATATM